MPGVEQRHGRCCQSPGPHRTAGGRGRPPSPGARWYQFGIGVAREPAAGAAATGATIVLTSTSTFGIVYDADPRKVGRNGGPGGSAGLRVNERPVDLRACKLRLLRTGPRPSRPSAAPALKVSGHPARPRRCRSPRRRASSGRAPARSRSRTSRSSAPTRLAALRLHRPLLDRCGSRRRPAGASRRGSHRRPAVSTCPARPRARFSVAV